MASVCYCAINFIPLLFISEIDCGTLPDPPNGVVDLTTTNFESEAMYTCNLGHVLSGSNTRVCTLSGTWSGGEPVCSRKFTEANIK